MSDRSSKTGNRAENDLLHVNLLRRDSLLPILDNPFFIVTPPYTRGSAGVTVLHLLCHYLNRAGNSAFIIEYPPNIDQRQLLPSYAKLRIHNEFPGGMQAPLLTQDAVDFYDDRQITPIVIYPEVYDNVFKASFFVRYLLNFPGLLAPHFKDEADYTFAYSRLLANRIGVDDVLYMSAADLGFWNRSGEVTSREGFCYYARKTRTIVGEKIEAPPPGAVEILSSQEMSRDEVRKIFWKSEAFYCYEDTALATEAILCGCPVVWVKSKNFEGKGLADYELGAAGACMSDEANGLARATASVDAFEHTVRSTFGEALETIPRLADEMKRMASAQPYRGTVTLDGRPQPCNAGRNRFAIYSAAGRARRTSGAATPRRGDQGPYAPARRGASLLRYAG